MAAKEAIVVRRKEISLLLVRGVTQEVMAKQFGVTQRQIAEDVKRIRLSNKKFLERDGADGLLGELLSHQGPRRKMLWEIVESGDANNREMISALKALGEEDDRLLRLGQAAGLLPDRQGSNADEESKPWNIDNSRMMQIVKNFIPDVPDDTPIVSNESRPADNESSSVTPLPANNSDNGTG